MISSIRLQNFRSYTDSAFDFEPGVNIIVGPNGSGKTNLLEAILLACTGSSYRAKDGELIKKTQPWARIDAYTEQSVSRVIKLEQAQTTCVKTFLINDKPHKRMKLDIQEAVVLFEPSQLQYITGTPENRRSLMDDILEKTNAEFTLHKRAYYRVLAQRNKLLKHSDKKIIESQLFVWNLRLCEFAQAVVEKRIGLADQLNETFSKRYQEISGKYDQVSVQYQASFKAGQYATQMLKKLEHDLSLDQARGFTGTGPHREDFAFSLNGEPLQDSASRGETRTILIALKNFEVDLIEQINGKKPLLLLDDVFGELDGARRKALTKLLRDHQSFITTTDADVLAKDFVGANKAHTLMLTGRKD